MTDAELRKMISGKLTCRIDKRYVNSINDKQLMNSETENVIDGSDPEATTGDTLLTVNKRDIAWKSVSEHKFGKHVFPKNFQNGTQLIGGASLDPSIPALL